MKQKAGMMVGVESVGPSGSVSIWTRKAVGGINANVIKGILFGRVTMSINPSPTSVKVNQMPFIVKTS